MTIKEQFYLKAVSLFKFLAGYFESKLGEYYTGLAVECADAFLKKFRSKKKDPNNFSAQKKRPLDPFCNHRKGGSVKKTTSADYSVAFHRFPDRTYKIWCLQGCGFVAYPGDANWRKAVEMLDYSSNRPSSSEIIMPGVRAKSDVEVVYQDKI